MTGLPDVTPIEAIPNGARSLDGNLFWSEDVFADDMERLFATLWIPAGHATDIPKPGDFFVRTIGRDSILVVRGKDDTVRAFYNICRHRGSRLVLEDEGHLDRVLCPYHAWAYGLDGGLLKAPLIESRSDFKRQDYGLNTVRLEEWNGVLFICLSQDTQPLNEQLAGVPDFSHYSLADLRLAHRIEYDVEANWKIICENYGECYHCPLAHPQLNRVSDFRNVGWSVKGALWNGGPMEVNDGFNTMSNSGKSKFQPLSPRAEDGNKIHYYHLYPNLLFSVAPDYLMTHTLWPLAPNKTRVICTWLFAPSEMERESFDPSDVIDFWDLTNRQDWELCARVQQGTGSRGYQQGPYQDMEVCVYTFDAWYLQHMGHAGVAENGGVG